MKTMKFHESYGTLPSYLLSTIKRCNVSPSDWDSMLTRWGYEWNEQDLPWEAIDNHIVNHSQNGSYSYPMYY